MVNHYYVYAMDRNFGPFFLKFCTCCRRCKSALFWRHEWVGANAWGMNKGGRFRPPFLIF
jgi:hypothetical protein